ncbi:hypothetical protein AOLI_G00307130 [Acnodon oligacanthus]
MLQSTVWPSLERLSGPFLCKNRCSAKTRTRDACSEDLKCVNMHGGAEMSSLISKENYLTSYLIWKQM